MEFHQIERPPDAFQQPVAAETILAMSHRAFGTDADVVSVRELGGGLYNTTYEVVLREQVTILRVAPEAARQSRLERSLMRNEHVALPYFAPIAAMMPRTLFADWTGELCGRDYLWQTRLDGVPGLEGLKTYPRSTWQSFYRQLGAITAQVHKVRGTRFGRVAGPGFATWSEAVLATFEDTIADLVDAGLDVADLQAAAAAVLANAAVLDEIEEPRLLHGDLWTSNVMLAADSPAPTIVGVLDHDRASWGDPAADWGLSLINSKPPEAQEAFRAAYGAAHPTPQADWRATVYQVLHLGAIRLERHRMGRFAKIPESYDAMSPLIGRL
ncbi:phosphotransferase family protein [Nocardia transvalensis]|uniref:phosphotransferase family protein n=1 Tax=Nocardia transvalensis TaxID=37333 RepID=UPI0018958739|nr:aminoglycoside phosphotransferase family protein [Nocardia transvalensis]MBF6333233.1 aminoglycoside phosphotransferase family protein [Nocardia transvalensis]